MNINMNKFQIWENKQFLVHFHNIMQTTNLFKIKWLWNEWKFLNKDIYWFYAFSTGKINFSISQNTTSILLSFRSVCYLQGDIYCRWTLSIFLCGEYRNMDTSNKICPSKRWINCYGFSGFPVKHKVRLRGQAKLMKWYNHN
jgi:hypothetical protein